MTIEPTLDGCKTFTLSRSVAVHDEALLLVGEHRVVCPDGCKCVAISRKRGAKRGDDHARGQACGFDNEDAGATAWQGNQRLWKARRQSWRFTLFAQSAGAAACAVINTAATMQRGDTHWPGVITADDDRRH